MDDISLTKKVLYYLYEYDSFLDSLTTIADMGCGDGEAVSWWANLTTRDEPPAPHNYKCYAVDRDGVRLGRIADQPNIFKIQRDFEELCLPIKVDLMCAFDSLQYSTNPLATLKVWNQQLNVDGMLVLTVPQHSGVSHNTYYSRSYSGCFYNFTPVSLIYMLAVNGFDCRDAYLLKNFNDPWIRMAVYKSNIDPMDPKTTSWANLMDAGLLHPSVVQSIASCGHVRQEDVLYPWLDRENYFIDYVSRHTEIPEEAGAPTVDGVFNTNVFTDQHNIEQAEPVQKKMKVGNSIGIMRPRKKKFE